MNTNDNEKDLPPELTGELDCPECDGVMTEYNDIYYCAECGFNEPED